MHYINLFFIGLTSALFSLILCAITRRPQSNPIAQRYYRDLLMAIRKGAVDQALAHNLNWSANYHLDSDLMKDEMVDIFYQNTASLFGYDDLLTFSSYLNELANYIISRINYDVEEEVFELPMQKLIALIEDAMFAQALSTSWQSPFINHYKDAFSFAKKITIDPIILNFFSITFNYVGRNEIEIFINELNCFYLKIKSL